MARARAITGRTTGPAGSAAAAPNWSHRLTRAVDIPRSDALLGPEPILADIAGTLRHREPCCPKTSSWRLFMGWRPGHLLQHRPGLLDRLATHVDGGADVGRHGISTL